MIHRPARTEEPVRRHSTPRENRKAVRAGNSERKRGSADALHCIVGGVAQQHAALAKIDPSSPRIRPTLASFALKGGER